jgi:hypothetical protein
MHTPKNERNDSMRLQQTALLIASAAALAACGAATPSPSASPTASPTSSPTPTSGSVVAAPSPTPARPSFVPLFLGFTDVDPDAGVLMLASGQATGPMPGLDATLTISGPLGGRLIGTDGHSIVALSSDGTFTTLEKNVAGSPSVVGRDDGQAWAWAVQTNSPACGSQTRATFDIYTDDGSGATKIASASFGAGVTQVTLAAWTAAGIVASGDNGCGTFGASTLAVSPAILINPTTGAATGLAPRIGSDCTFQDIADDGTIACYVGGSAPGIRVITPDGTQTKYSVPGLTSQQCIDGGVALSADASVASVSITCHMTTSTQLFLIDLPSGHVVKVTGGADLAPTLWTPDDILIASEFGAGKTYAVTPAGLATLINAKYAAQTTIG